MDPAEIEDLFDQLEDLSDSGPEVDNISVGSTPKPSLKPFFNSSRSLIHETQAVEENVTSECHQQYGASETNDQ